MSVMYGAAVAVREADLTLRSGEIVALMGRNGAGKSSLLWAIQGSGPRQAGRVDVAGLDPRGVSARAARALVGLVPQTASDLLYLETVAEECRQAERETGVAAGAAWSLLQRLAPGIDPQRHPRDLSEGQRLALVLAVQLTAAPDVMLLDEPTRGLDYTAKGELAAIVQGLADEGKAIVISTHDVEFVAAVARSGRRDGRGRSGDGRARAGRAVGLAGVRAPGREDPVAPGVADRRPGPGGARPGSRIGGRPMRPVIGLGARSAVVLTVASIAGLAMFTWPLFVSVSPAGVGHTGDAPFFFVATMPILVLVILAELADGGVDSKALAMLGILAAINAALRPLGAGTAGIETVFFLLVLAGRVFGAGFGFLLGSISMFASALLTGGVGPWLPFQMMAAAWVGLGAGLLPKAVRGKAEIALLAAYGVVAAYGFGAIMNLWFWPFATGNGTGISYSLAPRSRRTCTGSRCSTPRRRWGGTPAGRSPTSWPSGWSVRRSSRPCAGPRARRRSTRRSASTRRRCRPGWPRRAHCRRERPARPGPRCAAPVPRRGRARVAAGGAERRADCGRPFQPDLRRPVRCRS